LNLHLVGGFLGSGKTTAIIQAARNYMTRGLRVGVITNDQGKYLVDTAFVRLADVPAVEVTGGCFCCNYPDLDSSLDQILLNSKPDVIFAESVGSCADLVATVVKPLEKLKHAQLTPATFSVFTDARLLRRRLRGEPMPFSEDVVYIFDKQIEEAGLVVINKIDLLTPAAVEEVNELVEREYPQKKTLVQSSLKTAGVENWLALLDAGTSLLPDKGLELDYGRYGRGEAQLAWLDEEIILNGALAGKAFSRLVQALVTSLRGLNVAIGHLKLFVRSGDFETKISFVTLEEAGWERELESFQSDHISAIVNARVEMPAAQLRDLFQACLEKMDFPYTENGVNYFHPRQPNPTYRFS
jgi:Ni2+-binding GTPase involved in maturation of urease and hydrogenase